MMDRPTRPWYAPACMSKRPDSPPIEPATRRSRSASLTEASDRTECVKKI